MEIVYDLLLVLHLLGMAAIVGSWMVAVRDPKVLPPMLYGAMVQLVTGIALVGLAESGAVDTDVDNVKIAVKLAVAVVVAVLVVVNRRGSASKGVLHGIGGLALVNVLVAVLW